MREITQDRLQISYSGPTVRNGRIPITALSSGLRGQALMIERVGTLLFNGKVQFEVETDNSFERGSIIAPIHILADGLHAAENVLNSQSVTATVNFLGLLSFFGISSASLYSLFKRRRGRPITSPGDVPPRLGLDVSIETILRIYNDRDVQKYLRQSLEPLRLPGKTEIETLRNGVTINRIEKSDLEAADVAELEAANTNVEIDLGIEKAAWRRDLAWHFSDGETSFDAQIEDDEFWNQIAAGESFAIGDRLRVQLKTTAERTSRGRLKITRKIPKVFEIEHVRRGQRRLFD